MKKTSFITLIALMSLAVVLCGCQIDIQGPSASGKVFYKGENGNKEYLSRGSGMTGGNSYAAGGGKLFQFGDD